jgi:predicted RND superfamily exporter protein
MVRKYPDSLITSRIQGGDTPVKLQNGIINLSLRFPRTIMAAVVVLFIALGSQIPRIVIDTDPENMLPADQAARVFHNDVKKTFSLYDMFVVGVVNEEDPDGVFNPASLAKIHELTGAIEKIDGVIRHELLSLSTVDNISQGGPGVVRFEWMMKTPPATRKASRAVRAAAENLPMIQGTLLSQDGKAVAIYVPIEKKDESHRIATEIEEIIAGLEGEEEYFITGLPVAEDTFGVEMFKQMGIAAPLAGLIIFLLMWLFFRSIALIISPMIVAVATVCMTMGLLIGCGFTVHIMSSMIPIFLMPIAVVDSVHILSEFADLYPRINDRKKTIRSVMENLFTPMLYTSLTSAAGFASLAFAPIPPVQVFGVFVAIGITLAFLLTITFIPAYVVRLSDKRIAKLARHDETGRQPPLVRLLAGMGPRTVAASKFIVVMALVMIVASIWGISRIQVNDNPVRWFRPDHRIRVADRVLNEHFGGTYDAYLVLGRAVEPGKEHALGEKIAVYLGEVDEGEGTDFVTQWNALHESVTMSPMGMHFIELIDGVLNKIDESESAEAEIWEEVLLRLEDGQVESKFFQTPEALAYIETLQRDLSRSDLVGKSNSIADIVKTVHRELREGDETYFTIPGTSNAVAQTLLSYQSSHRPDDLWHFLAPDYQSANVWLQLKSGDNQDMVKVVGHVERFLAETPPPDGVTLDWAGLTHLNVVWQHDMVNGMFKALMGSFVIVFFMMLVLFRSIIFALLAMLPLSVTITFIYGFIGMVGKDYDMPVAVLSSLTLGLSVDFAIHFLQRARAIHRETANRVETIKQMFSEPARAIARNAIVIAIGFLPLLTSPLVPYNTVALFLCAIMTISCIITLILLPSVMSLFKKRLFAEPVVDIGPQAETRIQDT